MLTQGHWSRFSTDAKPIAIGLARIRLFDPLIYNHHKLLVPAVELRVWTETQALSPTGPGGCG